VKQSDGTTKLERKPRTIRTPYGTTGLAAPRTLARTETAHAFGAATVEAAQRSLLVKAVGWRLSAAHPQLDECDKLATQDKYGLGSGNYPPDKVPPFPPHPNCLCYLVQVQIPPDQAAPVFAQVGQAARGEPLPADADDLVYDLTSIAKPAALIAQQAPQLPPDS
jgi:hypothetical protein